VDEIISIGARGMLATSDSKSQPGDSLRVDVVLYARLTSGATVDTRSIDARLGFDVAMTKSVAVPRGETVPPGLARLSADDVETIVGDVGRGGLHLLEEALRIAVGRPFHLERLPLVLELDEPLLARIRAH
jgi:hypothetical protein